RPGGEERGLALGHAPAPVVAVGVAHPEILEEPPVLDHPPLRHRSHPPRAGGNVETRSAAGEGPAHALLGARGRDRGSCRTAAAPRLLFLTVCDLSTYVWSPKSLCSVDPLG